MKMKTGTFTFPEIFALTAHVSGAAISIWMGRWDLLAAGMAFGIPSFVLFHDLSPGGKGYVIRILKKFL
jgi:hypothetical protein